VALTIPAGFPVGLPARFPLAVLPTPLVRARHLERALGSPPIYVKRDDLTGFGFAGNKARKLEFIVGDALARGCDVLVTGGGPGSNHCASTAAAARLAGLGCLLVFCGSRPEVAHPNLALARSFGAEVRFTNDPDRESVDEALVPTVAELEAEGRRPCEVPRGGASILGAVGYVVAARELAAQLKMLGAKPSTVVVATGSCGTQAGLVAAEAADDNGWRVVGASVSRPVEECRRRVLDLARGCACLLGTAEPTESHVELVDTRGPGFGLTSAEGAEAARLAARTEGLLLDPVYTAKAFAVLVGLATSSAGGSMVFIHTGGAPAALWELMKIYGKEPSIA
jgi:1-aminocyclopropane-1-carboxylate deaminase/D-cysteine desulfhydrase-like pyridoxal-dependent ACC family enzyme